MKKIFTQPLLFVFAILIGSIPTLAFSQTKAEVDAFFEKTARNGTIDRMKYSDKDTQVIKLEYDKNRTELKFFYETSAIQDGATLDADRVVIAKTYLKDSGCKSYGAFMRSYDLKVIHTYFSKSTGRELFKFVVTKRDCKN
jgi:hypothetical protein